MANKISVIIDVAVDQANRGLKSFRQSIDDADGAAGKFKAGFGSAMDSAKANAGNLAMAGGAALVAFGVKAVGAFQDTAIEAGRLSESLGLTTEQASRFMEVAGDLGIDMGTVEKAIGKMNIEVSKSPAYFDQIGAAIAKNADGTTNVQQTFLNVVDAINRMPDATDRAAASQKLLGRGWKDMSELVGQGSTKLKASLDAVSDAKVIDEQEVEKARKYRAAMDQLSDSIQDLALAAGEVLVPALTKAAETTEQGRNAWSTLDDALGPVDESLTRLAVTNYKYLNPVGQVITALGLFGDEADDATESTDKTSQALVQESIDAALAAEATDNWAESTAQATRTAEDATKATDAQREALQRSVAAQLEAIDSSLGYRNQQARTAETIRAASLVTDDLKTSTDEAAQAARDAEGAALEQAAAAVRLAEDQAAANGQTIDAQQKAAIYRGELETLAGFLTGRAALAIQGHIDALKRIPTSVMTNISVNRAGDFIGGTINGRRAAGGPVSRGGIYEVVEGGQPELLEQNGRTYLMPGDDGHVTPVRSGASSGGAGGGLTVHIHAGIMPDKIQLGRLLKDAQAAYERAGGR
jgi:hypothetical protein